MKRITLALLALCATMASACAEDAGDTSAEQDPETSAAAVAATGAPRVFMAIHGSNTLANDDSLDSKWSYVRSHLDGLWANTAGVTDAEQAKLWRKVSTRNVIAEVALRALPDTMPGPMSLGDSTVERAFPDVVLNREAAAFYTDAPSDWDGRAISSLSATYVTNPSIDAKFRHHAVYTGWGYLNWLNPADSTVGVLSTAAAKAAVRDEGGMFMECVRYLCVSLQGQALVNAITAAHAQNKPFVLFASHGQAATIKSGWLQEFKSVYNLLEAKKLWRTTDIVMVINYQEAYPEVPEADASGAAADTATGLVYWALHH